MKNHKVYISLGSNIGNRKQYLADARSAITNDIGVITQASSLYETEPWGITDQTAYYNQVIELEVAIAPADLLAKLQTIELRLGRIRQEGVQYEPRTIDLDILLFGNKIVDTADIKIPHPRFHLRNFCLIPLLELKRVIKHPLLKLSIEDLYLACKDTSEIFLVEE